MGTQPGSKSSRIPCLHEDSARTREFTNESFTTAEAGDDTAGSRALEDVVAVPGYEMAVVDDVLLPCYEL